MFVVARPSFLSALILKEILFFFSFLLFIINNNNNNNNNHQCYFSGIGLRGLVYASFPIYIMFFFLSISRFFQCLFLFSFLFSCHVQMFHFSFVLLMLQKTGFLTSGPGMLTFSLLFSVKSECYYKE